MMLSEDCKTLLTYNNADCTGSVLYRQNFTLALGNYSTFDTCYDTTQQDSTYTMYMSQKSTCAKDTSWLTEPGYATFSTATSDLGCTGDISTTSVVTYAYSKSCSKIHYIINGEDVYYSTKATTNDNELSIEAFNGGSCSGSLLSSSTIITELDSCGQYLSNGNDDDGSSYAPTNLRSKTFVSETKESAFLQKFLSKEGIDKLVAPQSARFSRLLGQTSTTSGYYVYGSTETGNIPYISEVITATGGTNPATAGSSGSASGISGGAIAAIVIVLLLVATGAAYYFYSKQKAKSAMALQESSSNSVSPSAPSVVTKSDG